MMSYWQVLAIPRYPPPTSHNKGCKPVFIFNLHTHNNKEQPLPMMQLFNEQGQLFGRFNVLDAGFALLVGVVLLGVTLVQTGVQATSKNMVQGETDIEISLYLRTRTLNEHLFKAGDETNITVRNQPRGKVSIVSATLDPVKALVPQGSGYKVFPDPLSSNVYDIKLTLKDHATITPEGYVAEGVKMKIGLPIEIEGMDYRLSGVITKVAPVKATAPIGLD
jgi:hypothetical protein